MKPLRYLVAASAAVIISVAAFAADPTGTWKWSQPGRGDRPAIEQTLKLELKDGKLSGSLLGFESPMGKIPDTAIGDATFKDDALTFSVTREFNGRKRVSKYEAKLSGDTLTGSIERSGRNGETQKNEWTATRAK
ncbi:MAG TPA: hypothetical protein VGM64_01335 [Lacunisphaera sp.]|jgi:hypothetical protein